jgi:DNA helicase II / ATP-dependent DNA helicase PcrA
MNVPQHLRELNPEQQSAALATDGPVLILAGAGSGKTRTLVHRIVHLLQDGDRTRGGFWRSRSPTEPRTEMRERVTSADRAESEGPRCPPSTRSGRAFCGSTSSALIGLPKKFAIYCDCDQLALVRSGSWPKRFTSRRPPGRRRTTSSGCSTRSPAGRISSSTPRGAAAEIAAGRTRGNRSDDYAILAADVYPRYEESLSAAGACDFDDLLLLPSSCCGRTWRLARSLWRRWQYLMVDEYQDTNGAQLELARLLAGPRQEPVRRGGRRPVDLCMARCGFRNILEFERHFPGARVIVLEENYRSTQRILNAANAVIANNSARKPKRMRTDERPGSQDRLLGVRPRGDGRGAEEQEAAMVAREIGVRRFQ